MHEAMFWDRLDDGRVRCGLCRFACLIADGERGRCGVRENRHGELFTLVYGRAVAEHVDPVEKKPLFHYLPGSVTYSIATVGCNFHCLHCQNSGISQWPHSGREFPGRPLPPKELVRQAKLAECQSISYTYTEPTIFYEYAFDTAILAHEAGLGNLFVSNGYTSTAAVEKIAPVLDGANIDLKGFSEKFYREVTGASLSGVLKTIRDYRRLGIWLEITTLIIPGLNDGDDELTGIARFIAEELGPLVPWHVSAFYPAYRMLDRPPTPTDTLRRARRIGMDAGLEHVYVGNVPDESGENTYCPNCGELVIERRRYRLGRMNVKNGACGSCGTALAGVWSL